MVTMMIIPRRYLDRDANGEKRISSTIRRIAVDMSASLEEQLEAPNLHFSKDSPLVAHGLLMLEGDNLRCALDTEIFLDDRLGDFLLGYDQPVGSRVAVDGKLSVYTPTTTLDDVVLSKEVRSSVDEALAGLRAHFQLVQAQQETGLASSRQATVFLISGRHGVGKSMLADAIANSLQKQVRPQMQPRARMLIK
jgi:hypothetical protein